MLILGESLRAPKFLISHRASFARRLRRNYIYMFLILLLAWVLKISTPRLQEEGVKLDLVHSLMGAVDNARLGFLPGLVVVVMVAVFFAGLLVAAFFTGDKEGELAHGDVHV